MYKIQIEIGEDDFRVGNHPKQGDAAGKKAKKIVGYEGDADIKKATLMPFHYITAS